MFVENWSKVRSLMRTRRMTEVISELRGVRVQTVRRGGLPQTLCVPHEAGPIPRNYRDVEREASQAVPSPVIPIIDREALANTDDVVMFADIDDED